MGDNLPKGKLIPHTSYGRKEGTLRSLSLLDEPRSDYLVGEVMAHQDRDP